MSPIVVISVFFVMGMWVSMRHFGWLLDHLTEKGSNRGVKCGPWKTHLGVGRKQTPRIEKAAIARIGLGANDSDETIYWNAFTDDEGNLLRSENNYRIMFRSKPPVRYQDKGFWSITVYGKDKFLVPNPLKKYMIHSDDSLEMGREASFSIFLSRNEPDNPDSWIPLPATDEKFSIAFRCYVPDKDMKMNVRAIELPSILRI